VLARELDLKDHVFTLEGGMVIQDGESYHPDLVRLRIPKKLGLEIALQILQAVQHTRATTDDEFLIELPLFGSSKTLWRSHRSVRPFPMFKEIPRLASFPGNNGMLSA
jgi:hypothetical protein